MTLVRRGRVLLALTLTLTLFTLTLLTTVRAQLARSGNSGPIISHTFDATPSTPLTSAQGSYSWAAGTGRHTGLATFDGINNWIDLAQLPDANNNLFPTTLPASFTLEFWVRYLGWNANSRLIDLGAAQSSTTDEINIANVGTTSDLTLSAFSGASGGTLVQAQALSALDVDVFQHIVTTVDTFGQPAGTARYILYVDGVVRSNGTGAAPRAAASRQFAYIARSLLSTNALATFSLDTFNLYDYAIDYEQVTLHNALERFPVYEVTLGTDPRAVLGLSSATYSWMQTDPSDSAAIQQVRIGLLNLDASNSQYIDLTTATGTSSIGFALPRFGRYPAGAVTTAVDALTRGWTFEFLIKLRIVTPNARIFDCQTAAGTDGVSLAVSASNTLAFSVSNAATGGSAITLAIGSALTANTWYHIAIVSSGLVRTLSNSTTYTGYVNGVAAGTTSSLNVEIANVVRSQCTFGRASASASNYFDGLSSNVRLYNSALTAADVRKVYAVTQVPTPALPSNWTADRQFSTRPLFMWTFDDAPTEAQLAGGRVTWDSGAGKHSGLLTFDGANDYASINSYTDNYGANFGTAVFGGNLTIEMWVSWSSFRSWSRAFEVGSAGGTTKDSLIITNRLTTSKLGFCTFGGSGDSSDYLYASSALQLNTWYHLVFTVQQNDYSVATGGQAATLSVYMNRVHSGSLVGYLPRTLVRSNGFFGRSNTNVALFNGLIDDLYIYNYTLSPEAIDAHYVVPRVPAFELVFDQDPRNNMRLPASFARYDWNQLDGSDAQVNRTAHVGLLRLNAAAQQFVNVSAYGGAAAVGTVMPRIGGPAWGSVDMETLGWSFEATFKVLQRTSGVRIFEYSSGGANSVWLGFSDASTLTFSVTNAALGTRTVTVMTAYQVGQWYHVLVVVQASSASSTRFVAYLDGVFVTSQNNAAMPDAVDRADCLLGRSFSTSAPYFDGWIDSVRVYDYALDASEAAALSSVVHNVSQIGAAPSYHTDPVTTHSFDYRMSPVQLADSSFVWAQQVASRQGIASFDGLSQFVNLPTLPDRILATMPTSYGNRSLSFEVWARWLAFNNNSHLFDLSQRNTLADRIAVSNAGTSNSLRITVGYSTVPLEFDIDGVLQLNKWHHVVLTLESSPSLPLTAPNSCTVAVYLDGALLTMRQTMTPRLVPRQTAYLARSAISTDAFFYGYIDTFYYYDYPLDWEQVRAHYTLQRVPEYELTFANDPRQIAAVMPSPSVAKYGWVEVDSSDPSSDQASHNGILVLSPDKSAYVDLNAPTGAWSVGAVLPMLADLNAFGNTTWFDWATRDRINSRIGMTLEISFKIASTSQGAHLFSCGISLDKDYVMLGWTGSSSDALTFSVYNSLVGRSKSVTVLSSPAAGVWYHVVIVQRIYSVSAFTTSYEVFVNGQPATKVEDGVFPFATPRPSCFLGRSSWSADSLFSGSIDVLRMYDYALLASEVPTLYQATSISAASSSSSLSSGAIAGIVIGAFVGVLIIAAVFVLSLRRLKAGSTAIKDGENRSKHVDVEDEAPENSEVEMHEQA